MKYDNVKLVMGWDIGDGESVAFAWEITGKKMIPLYLCRNRDIQVEKSAVAKMDDGTILIGADAIKNSSHPILHFKRDPKNWDAKSHLGVTYKQHMKDFIQGMSEAILQNNSNKTNLEKYMTEDENGKASWKQDDILLVVGCPASDIWRGTEQDYEKLIAEATGIQNVIVEKESRAAVFSLFSQTKKSDISIQDGVLVIDLGSSTADATCIIPGKQEMNLSWQLGAAEIENAMLDYILQEATESSQLPENQLVDRHSNACDRAVFEMRTFKEQFFNKNIETDGQPYQTVLIPMIDLNGNPIEIPRSITFKIKPEIITYAIGGDPTTGKAAKNTGYSFDVRKDGNKIHTGTWIENYREFLTDVKQTLAGKKIDIKTIVITGGGSNMPFTTAVCKEKDIFGDKKYPNTPTPSHSVVTGLTMLAYNEVISPPLREQAMAKIVADCKPNIEPMLQKVSEDLAGIAIDTAIRTMKGIDGDTTTNTLFNAIATAVDDTIKQHATAIMEPGLRQWHTADTEVIMNTISSTATTLYANAPVVNVFPDISDISGLVRQSNLLDNFNLGANINNIVQTMMLKLFDTLSFIFGGILLIGLIATNPVLLIAALLADDGITSIRKHFAEKNRALTHNDVVKLINKLEKGKTKKTKEVCSALQDTLKIEFTKPAMFGEDFSKHDDELRAIGNKVFDMILLKTD